MAADWQQPGDTPSGATWGVMKGQPGEMMEWQKGTQQWNPNRGHPQGVANWTQGPSTGGQDPWDMGAGATGWTQQTAGGQMPGIGPGRMAPDEERRKRREERIKTEEEGRKDKE